MKYLQTYKFLRLANKNEDVFNYLMNNLKRSIFTWDYFVNFKKVRKNILAIERELNLLNVLIGKKDIELEFINLIGSYPKVRSILPILIAIRNTKVHEMPIIDNFDTLVSEDKGDLFNPSVALTPKLKDDLIKFFTRSGLKEIFEDKSVKSIVDYCFGIEVGMDTNARKNRTGTSMETLVEAILKKFCKENKLEYIPQATQSKIKGKWNFDIQLDKTDRHFDFAVFNLTKKKLFLLETNFYGSQGSKLKSTAGEYQYLFDFLRNQKIDLIWITDGVGWKTATNALYETFLHNDYLFNIELLKKGILKDIIV